MISSSPLQELLRSSCPTFGPRYYAGIWEQYLHEQLCWRANGEHCTRPSTHRAPTWSWASLDGGVRSAEYFGTWLLDWSGTRFIECWISAVALPLLVGHSHISGPGGQRLVSVLQ